MKDQPSAAPESAAPHSIEYSPDLTQSRHSSSSVSDIGRNSSQDGLRESSPESRNNSSDSNRLLPENLKGNELTRNVELSDGKLMSTEEQALRRMFRGEFDHSRMDIPEAEQGLRNQSGLANGGAQFIYDPGERADGLQRATRSRVDDKDIISKSFKGRPDGLMTERLSLSSSSQELVRSFADSSTEKLVVNRDSSREFVRTNSDGSRTEVRTTSSGEATTENFDRFGNLKSTNLGNAKTAKDAASLSPAPLAEPRLPDDAAPTDPAKTAKETSAETERKTDDPKTAKEQAHLEQFRKQLEDSNFELSPIKNGKGPFHSLRDMQKRGEIKMSHEQMMTESQRISKRHLEEDGTKDFNRGDRPKMYSEREIDKRVEAERQRIQQGEVNPKDVDVSGRKSGERPGEKSREQAAKKEFPTEETSKRRKRTHDRGKTEPDPKTKVSEAPDAKKPDAKLPTEQLPKDKTAEERTDASVPGSTPKILDPVTDREILKRVPDATYIGQEGTVTSTANPKGEIKPYWLARDAARALADANKMLEPLGKKVLLESKNGGGRTVDTQTEIYTRSRGGTHFHAGAPTQSNHTRGRAMDVANHEDRDVKRALLAVGFRQGDSHGTISGDEHHYSFPGSYREPSATAERTRERDGQPERVARRDRHSHQDREARKNEGANQERDGQRRSINPGETQTPRNDGEFNREPQAVFDKRSAKKSEDVPRDQEAEEHRRSNHHRESGTRHRGRRQNDGTSTQSYRNQGNVKEGLPAIAHPQGGDPEKVSLKSEPTISAAQIDRILAENNSPAARERIRDSETGKEHTFGEHLYKLGVEYGIDPAIALGFFKAESTFGKFGKAASTNSFGNIRGGPGFRGYDTFADGARDWFKLVTGDLYFGSGRTTLGPILYRYAPPSENDTAGYIRNVAQDARRWSARGRVNG